MERRKRIDRNAEDDIARLCRFAGASVQKVSEDDNGYDLIVEFPPQVETAFPDTDEPLTRCLIQVKSTQSRRKNTRVKLSNALKFAKDELPCFVVLVTYPSASLDYERIYLRHIWTTDMATALEKARLCSSEASPLNKRHISVNFNDSERVDSELSNRIITEITRQGTKYGERKKQIRDSLGYEDGWGDGHFILAQGHDQQDLQDLLLGRRDELPIDSFTITEKRFGVPGATRSGGAGKLTVKVEPRARCVITLQRRGSQEQLSWTGGIFASGMAWLPPEQQKVRIAAGPLDLLISTDRTMKPTWSAPLDELCSLDDLERNARFRSWMDGSQIDLDVWADQGSKFSGTLTFSDADANADADADPDADKKWEEIIEAIQAISRAVPLERRPDDMKTSMSSLLERFQYHRQFAALTQTAPLSLRVENPEGLEAEFSTATHVVFPCVTKVGNYFVVSVVEREVISVTSEDTTITFSTRSGRILRGTTLHHSGATDDLVAKEVEWVRARAEAGDRAVLSFQPEGNGSYKLTLSTP
ncbi:hypothetical protein [Brevundimonas sp.]|uniref:hypothetical protein n=1 Tax=Brevundimonas sp. TaxID=1871086 RepID=UPI003AF8B5FC